MKTATLPSLRIDPSLRQAAESVLRKGETLSALMETAVAETIQRRQAQAAFVARGLLGAQEAARCNTYFAANAVHGELQTRLNLRRQQALE
jgi:predicted transcriptional regulator